MKNSALVYRVVLLVLLSFTVMVPLNAQDNETLVLGANPTESIPDVLDDSSIDSLKAANAILEKGHMAFGRKDFAEAMRLYRRVALAGYETPSVWTNAGAAAYRNDDRGHAVLYFSRALRLDPSYDRALTSLEVVTPATNRVEENFAQIFLHSLFVSTRPGLWIGFAQFFVLIVWYALARIISVSDRDRRAHWFSVLAWSLAFMITSVALGWGNHRFREGGNTAVVIVHKAVTRSAPSMDSMAQLELPSGTIIELTEQPRSGFVRVKLKDGRAGYISTELIEKI